MNDSHITANFKLSSSLRTFSHVAPYFVVVWSVLILIGWWLNIAWLKNPFPDRIPPAPTAASLLILCSVAILLLRQTGRAWALIGCRLLAALVVTCAGAIFCHYLGGVFDLDQLLFSQPLLQFGPGRLSFFGALSLALFGTAIFLFSSRRKSNQLAAQTLTIVVLFIAFTTLTGYVYDRSIDLAVIPMVPPALPVAIMVAVLCLAILAMHRDLGLVSLFISDAQGGRIYRMCLPFAVFTPLIGGWLRLIGQGTGMINTAIGVSAMVVFESLVLVCVAYFAAKAANKTDINRIAAEAELKKRKLLLEAILNSVAEGIVVADTKGVFLSSNTAATRITGIEAKGQAPETWSQEWGYYMSDGVTPIEVMDLPLVRAMRGESVDDLEVILRNPARPDGVLVSINARPLDSEHCGYSGGVEIIRDVKAKKHSGIASGTTNEVQQTTDQAQLPSPCKSAYQDQVTNEICEPMVGIIGICNILVKTELTEEQRQYIEAVRAAGEAVLTTVQAIPESSKAEADNTSA